MRQKLLITYGLWAGVLAFPLNAVALGLGKLSVQSGLGQPLSAQIELSSAAKEELDSLRAKVADPSVYRDNNAQYVGALSRARIALEMGPNNTPFLRVTSPQAINEPYLDLIVEVSWATGRLVRNYTFLLDPPGAIDAQAVEPAPTIRAQTTAPAPTPSRATRPAPSAAAPDVAAKAGDTANSYAVKRGDTLSKIAKEYKPDNVSLEQMLVALFRTNEGAFDGSNMNRLRTGQILNLPASDQISSVDQPQAAQIVRVQAADWRAYRDRVASGAPVTEATGSR
jgi:pilus assembly protein FimV